MTSTIAERANTRFNESIRFQRSLVDTTIGFRAFGYNPGKTTTLCGQCETRRLENLRRAIFDASHNCPIESTKFNGDGREGKHEDARRER